MMKIKCSIIIFMCLCINAKCQVDSTDWALKQKIGQMFIAGFRGSELKSQMTIYKLVSQWNLGGVILFDTDVPSKGRKERNIVSPAQLQKLCSDLQKAGNQHLFISIDQEGGKVCRLKEKYGFPPTASAEFLGSNNKPETTSAYAARTADVLKSLGINLNFAPCVDLNINPDCPIIGSLERSFGSNPQVVISNARIWISEAKKRGIVSAIKHFPGHGSSLGDTHRGMVDVTSSYDVSELMPYRTLIADDEIDMVMSSHIFNAHFDKSKPATLSAATLTGVLKKELGFKGVVVSDDLSMGAIAKMYDLETALQLGIEAGVDIFILSNNGETYDDEIVMKAINIVFSLVKSGRLNENFITESYAKISKLKARYGL